MSAKFNPLPFRYPAGSSVIAFRSSLEANTPAFLAHASTLSALSSMPELEPLLVFEFSISSCRILLAVSLSPLAAASAALREYLLVLLL